MKKSSFLIAALLLTICFSSCKKEKIEIVNQSQSDMTTSTSRSSAEDFVDDGVTDPNDDTSKDLDKKNSITGG